ncbi:MAG: DUF2782 domain-containing protein [Gammaproteobacteria bacterium]|jgi:hypothetical protein|nr:DUF2782 domain-containing protein [Gammaproteobacteria bacterium]
MPAAPPLHQTVPPLLGGLLITLTALAQQADLSSLDLRVTAADIQPSVTIEEYDNRTVERYSVNNNTYMLKVTPNVGAPYYLVDDDGSGDMAWRRNTPGMHTQVPQWTLLSW